MALQANGREVVRVMVPEGVNLAGVDAVFFEARNGSDTTIRVKAREDGGMEWAALTYGEALVSNGGVPVEQDRPTT